MKERIKGFKVEINREDKKEFFFMMNLMIKGASWKFDPEYILQISCELSEN